MRHIIQDDIHHHTFVGHSSIDIQSLIDYQNLTDMLPVNISKDKVYIRGGRLLESRIENADDSYPVIVIVGADNKSDKTFSMIDGRHRTHKSTSEYIKCYLHDVNALIPFLRA
jgi:hypothetical protein